MQNIHFDRLISGNYLSQGLALVSPSKNYFAIMQGDGNFVVYVSGHFVPKNAIFATHTENRGIAPYNLIITESGNVEVIDGENKTLFSSHSEKKGAKLSCRLVMEDSGNLVLYEGENIIWDSISGTENKLMTLGYWNVKGRVQPIRKLLAYLGVKYEFKRIMTGEEWMKIRPTLNTEFPNLPYLQCGDKVLTESGAIFAAICLYNNREDLLGATDEEKISIFQIEGVIEDAKAALFQAMLTPGTTEESFHTAFDTKILPIFEKLVLRLGTNNFLIGKLSKCDFNFFSALEMLHAIDSKFFFSKVPSLLKYMENFRSIPELKEFLGSDDHKNTPFLLPFIVPEFLTFKG